MEVCSWRGKHAKDIVQPTRDLAIAIDCTRKVHSSIQLQDK